MLTFTLSPATTVAFTLAYSDSFRPNLSRLNKEVIDDIYLDYKSLEEAIWK